MSLAKILKSSWFAIGLWPLRAGFARFVGLFAVVMLLFSLIAYGITYRWNVGYYLCRELDPNTMTIITHAEPGVFCLPELLKPEHDDVRIRCLWILFEPAYQVDRWWRPDHWARKSISWENATVQERADALGELTVAERVRLEKMTGRSLWDEAHH